MILSRTMREKDYDEMVAEGQVINDVHKAIEMWYPCQHQHRLWEYALAQKALKAVFGNKQGLTISDHGCGAGFLSPIMYWLGHNVLMYECWTFGDETAYMMEQMRKTALHRPVKTGTYEMRNRPLGGLTKEDKGVDAAFCISTLEHIREYQAAFRDLLNTVKPGGMAMVTTDFAEDELDHYEHAGLRAGKMFTQRTYLELADIAREMGFHLVDVEVTVPEVKVAAVTSKYGTVGSVINLDEIHDWVWDESCRLVLSYGFASLVVVKEKE